MPALWVAALAGLVKLLERVCMVRLQQAVPRAAVVQSIRDHHRFLDEAGQHPKRVDSAQIRADASYSLQREPALKHCEAPEQPPLIIAQEPVAPIDGAEHGLLA